MTHIAPAQIGGIKERIAGIRRRAAERRARGVTGFEAQEEEIRKRRFFRPSPRARFQRNPEFTQLKGEGFTPEQLTAAGVLPFLEGGVPTAGRGVGQRAITGGTLARGTIRRGAGARGQGTIGPGMEKLFTFAKAGGRLGELTFDPETGQFLGFRRQLEQPGAAVPQVQEILTGRQKLAKFAKAGLGAGGEFFFDPGAISREATGFAKQFGLFQRKPPIKGPDEPIDDFRVRLANFRAAESIKAFDVVVRLTGEARKRKALEAEREKIVTVGEARERLFKTPAQLLRDSKAPDLIFNRDADDEITAVTSAVNAKRDRSITARLSRVVQEGASKSTLAIIEEQIRKSENTNAQAELDIELKDIERRRRQAQEKFIKNSQAEQTKRRKRIVDELDDPGKAQRELLAEEEFEGAKDIVREFATRGEVISLKKGVNIWRTRQKANEGETLKFAEVAEILDETILNPAFDKEKAFETATKEFDDNVTQAEKYMKSRGFLKSEIARQKETFQLDVLGFTQEEIDQDREKTNIVDIIRRSIEGEELSIANFDKLEKFEATSPKAAFRLKLQIQNPDLTEPEIWKLAQEAFEEPRAARRVPGAPVPPGERTPVEELTGDLEFGVVDANDIPAEIDERFPELSQAERDRIRKQLVKWNPSTRSYESLVTGVPGEKRFLRRVAGERFEEPAEKAAFIEEQKKISEEGVFVGGKFFSAEAIEDIQGRGPASDDEREVLKRSGGQAERFRRFKALRARQT